MSALLIETIAELRGQAAPARRSELAIGFVPTMGALHAGHARLIERARSQCGCVVVSIFVNPLQFDRADDLERYPRTRASDLDLCRSLGVDIVFAPAVGEMYPGEPSCLVQVGRLGDHLCGRFRPGHFSGVATVVLKLFEIVQPDTAFFGEKDAQQLAVIRRLVRDFNIPVHIEGVETVREADGLALSSRNRGLNLEERRLAVSLYDALCDARERITGGASDPAAVKAAAAARIPADERLRLEYLEIVDPVEIQPVETIAGRVLVAGALWVGSTRLIDNVICDPPAHHST